MGELGSRLLRAREARGLTIEDAERDTRISRRYLQALESEQYDLIPAPVYARGFLRSYSQYLGLDPQEILVLFPREDEPGYVTATSPARASKENPISAVGPARPTWKRPTPPRTGPQRAPARPAIGRPAPARQPEASPQQTQAQWEPTIGIDIGVPVPARRIKQDPGAQVRTLSVAAVAIVVILAVILLAYFISRMGGGDDATGGPSPGDSTGKLAPSSQLTSASGGQTTQAGAQQKSGLPVVPGQVPDLISQPAEKARLAIVEAGYKADEKKQKSANVPRGSVVDQSPAAGTKFPEGSTVTILVSDGP